MKGILWESYYERVGEESVSILVWRTDQREAMTLKDLERKVSDRKSCYEWLFKGLRVNQSRARYPIHVHDFERIKDRVRIRETVLNETEYIYQGRETKKKEIEHIAD